MGYQWTLTVHRWVICVLSMGFMWVLEVYRWVLSIHLHSMEDGLSEHGWVLSDTCTAWMGYLCVSVKHG